MTTQPEDSDKATTKMLDGGEWKANKTVNQFHPDYADEAINEMTLTIQRQSQRIEELEQEASGQYMTGYEVARAEFQQRIQELEAQAAQPEHEPVAKVMFVEGLKTNNLLDCDLPVGTLLYTTQPQRKPLTDEQIKVMWRCSKIYGTNEEKALAFARVIEAAHGKGDA